MNNQTSRIAVITGGNRGLGKSMALHLADRGVDIVLTYRVGAETARDVVAQLEAKGRKAVALPLDVAESAGYPAFATALAGALQATWQRDRFDYLVNNAGTGLSVSIVEATEAQFDEQVRVHLKAALFLTQRLLPLIVDGGKILNVSSGLARMTFPGSAVYAAMKAGVETLTRYMARELAARKIRVNVIAPGAIETDFRGGAIRDNAQVNQMVASGIALGRVGLPDDVGAAVAMLLSDDSNWITGQRIEVSGGQML